MTFLIAKKSHLQAQIYEGEIISYSFPPARKRLYNIDLTRNAYMAHFLPRLKRD